MSLEEAQELQRRVKELEEQLEESERNYADIHKAWTDASGYYSKIEHEVQVAHEKYVEEKNWFDTSMKESSDAIQKLEESLQASVSDNDRLTQIVSNYEKELFKLKKEGSKLSALESKVSELQLSLKQAQEEGKARLDTCIQMEEEANKMIAQAEEALGRIIQEEGGLQMREAAVAEERKACEEWARNLDERERALGDVAREKVAQKSQKKDPVKDTKNKAKASRSAKTQQITAKNSKVVKEKKTDTLEPKNEVKASRTKAALRVQKSVGIHSPKEKKTASTTEKVATKKGTSPKEVLATEPKQKTASRVKKNTVPVTKKAPSVQKTTATKKKKAATANKNMIKTASAISETTSTRTRSGRTIKRKTFDDE